MDSKKSNKISDIVRLRQILKKWKKVADSKSSSSSSSSSSTTSAPNPLKFIKRTLSFTDISSSSSSSSVGSSTNNNNSNNEGAGAVPKGYLAVCVGKELKRYVIPTEYLRHKAFGILLREAEEEFGFQQQGVLKIPCSISVFENILNLLQHPLPHDSDHSLFLDNSSPHPQLCT